jgi:hypothetical protein
MPDTKSAVARELKELLIRLSPLIEEYTKQVCPECTDVCCRQMHAMLREKDVCYLAALGAEMPAHDPAHSPEGPCQFLGPAGCSQPRWQRAWKCTWYFCDPLLKAMGGGPQKTSRRIAEMMNRAIALRERL